jgi:hypothetical protein
MIKPEIIRHAPTSIIDAHGKPVFGQFDTIPHQLNIERFDYRNAMDNRANKLQRYFHYKQFQFVSVVTSSHVIGVAIADIRYLGSAFCYVYNIKENRIEEQSWLRPLSLDKVTTSSPFHGDTHIARGQILFSINQGKWTAEIKTKQVQAHLEFLSENNSPPLSMATPTGYSGWTYTQKHNALAVSGKLIVDGNDVNLDNALGGYDFSAGYMRRETSWCWASINTHLVDESSQPIRLGLNLAAGVNETGTCENALWVNGIKHLLPSVYFEFDRDDITQPWQVYSEDRRIDLTFTPCNKRSEKLNLLVLKSNFRQFIGHFSGSIKDNNGVIHQLDHVLGLTEDHFARW